MPHEPRSPRRRRKEARPAEILAAALDVFLPWAHEATLMAQCQARDWMAALATLERNHRLGAISRDVLGFDNAGPILSPHCAGQHIFGREAGDGVQDFGLFIADRIGLNFTEVGTGVRASVTLYDRGHSAASNLKPGMIDFKKVFGQGVRWLHTGGIFTALSDGCAAVANALLVFTATPAATEASRIPRRVSMISSLVLWEVV